MMLSRKSGFSRPNSDRKTSALCSTCGGNLINVSHTAMRSLTNSDGESSWTTSDICTIEKTVFSGENTTCKRPLPETYCPEPQDTRAWSPHSRQKQEQGRERGRGRGRAENGYKTMHKDRDPESCTICRMRHVPYSKDLSTIQHET